MDRDGNGVIDPDELVDCMVELVGGEECMHAEVKTLMHHLSVVIVRMPTWAFVAPRK